jgi:hypothetical protein
MAELKTQKTTASVSKFVEAISDPKKRNEARVILMLMKRATSLKPVLWGTTMIGFGEYYYESTKSSQKGHWPLIAYAPRKNMHTLYIMPGLTTYTALLKKLGPHTHTVSCLHIKKLSDIDQSVLTALVTKSLADMKEKYPLKQRRKSPQRRRLNGER